jgi:hypothetical protein
MSSIKERLADSYPEILVLLMSLGTEAYDWGISKNPRSYPPVIENHFGNFTPAMLLSEAVFIIAKGMGMPKSKSATTAFIISSGMTVLTELLTPNNSEFVGDVLFGLAGSLLAIGLITLLPRPNRRHLQKSS